MSLLGISLRHRHRLLVYGEAACAFALIGIATKSTAAKAREKVGKMMPAGSHKLIAC